MVFYSPTMITKQLERFGESVDIYRKTSGILDDYGDASPTWAKQTSENVLFDMPSSFKFSHEVAGRMKDVEILAYAKSASVVIGGDYLDATTKWFVLFTEDYKVSGNTLYKILFLKRFE